MLIFPLENGVCNGVSEHYLLQPVDKECFRSDGHVSALYPGAGSIAVRQAGCFPSAAPGRAKGSFDPFFFDARRVRRYNRRL